MTFYCSVKILINKNCQYFKIAVWYLKEFGKEKILVKAEAELMKSVRSEVSFTSYKNKTNNSRNQAQ